MSTMSMTGFGRGTALFHNRVITVEAASVNRKQFDCSLTLPRDWAAFEPRLQACIKKRLSRGYVKVSVTIAAQPGEVPVPQVERFSGYFSAIRGYAQALGLTDDLSAKDLLRIPEILKSIDQLEPSEELYTALEAALEQALDGLIAMREKEGALIAVDIRRRLAGLEELHGEIAAIAPDVPKLYREGLLRRIDDLLADARIKPTDEQIARETALFADKCDISEELTRMQAHFAHAAALLESPEPCGRALDFLCQELFREINTTGSKASNTGISHTVIAFKALLETLREQVQNLE